MPASVSIREVAADVQTVVDVMCRVHTCSRAVVEIIRADEDALVPIGIARQKERRPVVAPRNRKRIVGVVPSVERFIRVIVTGAGELGAPAAETTPGDVCVPEPESALKRIFLGDLIVRVRAMQ